MLEASKATAARRPPASASPAPGCRPAAPHQSAQRSAAPRSANPPSTPRLSVQQRASAPGTHGPDQADTATQPRRAIPVATPPLAPVAASAPAPRTSAAQQPARPPAAHRHPATESTAPRSAGHPAHSPGTRRHRRPPARRQLRQLGGASSQDPHRTVQRSVSNTPWNNFIAIPRNQVSQLTSPRRTDRTESHPQGDRGPQVT